MNRRILIAAFQALASLSWLGRGSRVSTSPLERFEVRRIGYLKSSYAVSITGPCPTGVITANRSSLLCSFEDRNEHLAANRTTLLIEIYLRFRRFFDSVMQPRSTRRVIYHPFSFFFSLFSFLLSPSSFLSSKRSLFLCVQRAVVFVKRNRYRSKLVSGR